MFHKISSHFKDPNDILLISERSLYEHAVQRYRKTDRKLIHCVQWMRESSKEFDRKAISIRNGKAGEV